MEIMEWKSTILEMENITWGLEQWIQNSRRICEFEDRAIEIIALKNKLKKKKKPEENEQSLKGLWDTVTSQRRGEKVAEKIFQEIIAETSQIRCFVDMGKVILKSKYLG